MALQNILALNMMLGSARGSSPPLRHCSGTTHGRSTRLTLKQPLLTFENRSGRGKNVSCSCVEGLSKRSRQARSYTTYDAAALRNSQAGHHILLADNIEPLSLLMSLIQFGQQRQDERASSFSDDIFMTANSTSRSFLVVFFLYSRHISIASPYTSTKTNSYH